MRTEQEIAAELQRLDSARATHIPPYRRWTEGQLSGAQQALAWVVGDGMDPIHAILTESERRAIGIQD